MSPISNYGDDGVVSRQRLPQEFTTDPASRSKERYLQARLVCQ